MQDGSTALMQVSKLAKANDAPDIIVTLMDLGADYDLKDNVSSTMYKVILGPPRGARGG